MDIFETRDADICCGVIRINEELLPVFYHTVAEELHFADTIAGVERAIAGLTLKDPEDLENDGSPVYHMQSYECIGVVMDSEFIYYIVDEMTARRAPIDKPLEVEPGDFYLDMDADFIN